MSRIALTLLLCMAFSDVHAQTPETTSPQPLGIALENFDYPHPVHYLPLTLDGQDLRMAYMDVPPAGGASANAVPVMLFHGKNFFGAYWENTIRALTQAGHRVIVPDQVGFGKSSKPAINYSFHLLAANTKALLDKLGVQRVAVVGHSMGGMLATRFALMYPGSTSHLILENPIGLEDYRTTVPYTRTEEFYQDALKTTAAGARRYHETYYVKWKPEYDKWAQVQYRMNLGGEAPRLAWVSAITTQMIYEQPVVHQFPEVRVPTLLVIGQEDRTTIGRNKLSPEALKTMGQYPQLGKQTARAIPGARLVEIPNVGHIPHFESPDQFHQPLIQFLQPR